MYRKMRRPGDGGILGLDSLMDILSCLVGVMLFMVIYTVLELGSTAFEVELPTVRDPPPGSEPVLVVSSEGTVRVLDTRAPLRTLLRGFGDGSPSEAEAVARVNGQAPRDAHFRYTLEHRARFTTLGGVAGTIDLRVDEIPGAVGDSAHQLGEGSTYEAALARLSPNDAWLEFVVDSTSLEVFRQARTIASARGFATQWNPWAMEFPLAYALSPTGTRAQLPRGTLSKPQR